MLGISLSMKAKQPVLRMPRLCCSVPVPEALCAPQVQPARGPCVGEGPAGGGHCSRLADAGVLRDRARSQASWVRTPALPLPGVAPRASSSPPPTSGLRAVKRVTLLSALWDSCQNSVSSPISSAKDIARPTPFLGFSLCAPKQP